VKTEKQVNLKNFIRISVKGDLRYKFYLVVGYFSHKMMNFIHMTMKLYSQYKKGINNSQNGALTTEIREEFRQFHEHRPEDEINARQVPFTEDELIHPKACHDYAARLLFDTLSDRTLGIRSALNIGCYSDRHFSYMAQKFPDIKFCSVDLLSEQGLSFFNKYLPKSSNWTFRSGYALELLKNGEIDADLVFMTSASYQFNNKELDLYLDEITKRAKVLVIAEYWGAYTDSSRMRSIGLMPKIVLPEDIPENDPFTRAISVRHFIYAHNYPAKLEKLGFEIKLSRIEASEAMFMYVYQLVAVKR
jgi:hypothetical protein